MTSLLDFRRVARNLIAVAAITPHLTGCHLVPHRSSGGYSGSHSSYSSGHGTHGPSYDADSTEGIDPQSIPPLPPPGHVEPSAPVELPKAPDPIPDSVKSGGIKSFVTQTKSQLSSLARRTRSRSDEAETQTRTATVRDHGKSKSAVNDSRSLADRRRTSSTSTKSQPEISGEGDSYVWRDTPSTGSSDSAMDDSGPVIEPLPQPIVTRHGVIHRWPYSEGVASSDKRTTRRQAKSEDRSSVETERAIPPVPGLDRSLLDGPSSAPPAAIELPSPTPNDVPGAPLLLPPGN